MKVAEVITIFTERRDTAVANQLFQDAVIWRALRDRLEELNELDAETAREKTTLLAMAMREAADLLLKCSGVITGRTEAERRSAHQHARSHHKEECQCDDCSWTEKQ